MGTSRFRLFFVNNNFFKDNPMEHRRTQLINIFLVLAFMCLLYLIVGNGVVHKNFTLCKILAISTVPCVLILVYFHLTNNITVTAGGILLFIVGLFYFYIENVGPVNYSLVWLLVFPPVFSAIFMGKRSRLIILLFLSFIWIYTYLNYDEWVAVGFTPRSLSNLVIGTLMVLIISVYNEKGMRDMRLVLEAKNKELEWLSITDSLTGVYNRNKLRQYSEEAITQIGNKDTPFSIFLIDIDHFKEINDTYGHLVGDDVLRFIATKLQESFAGIGVVGRWGGDELIVMGKDLSMETARELALRFLVAMRQEKEPNVGIVTVSIGIASLRSDDSFDTLLGRADKALYTAKNNGRDCVEIALS
ncbi:MAG: GGDEF domain-containing protein [Sphaerochaetaceae bacterium]